MKNKTIANWLIASLIACVLFAGTEGGVIALAGFGALLFSIMAIVRIRKIDAKDWLWQAFTAILIVFTSCVLSSSSESTIATWGFIFWIPAVWSIIRLYNAPDDK